MVLPIKCSILPKNVIFYGVFCFGVKLNYYFCVKFCGVTLVASPLSKEINEL